MQYPPHPFSFWGRTHPPPSSSLEKVPDDLQRLRQKWHHVREQRSGTTRREGFWGKPLWSCSFSNILFLLHQKKILEGRDRRKLSKRALIAVSF